MGEFDLIARYLRPLAGSGAMGLTDDAARSFGRILTKDMLVEGVHFLRSDPLDLVARKALRVNMSDLIAKAARPTAYMLGLVWPKRLNELAFKTFAEGLEFEHNAHGLQLLGGDTTSGDQLVVSVTMFGEPMRPDPLLRSGGEDGDLLVVTGRIGDGVLGLEAARLAPAADDSAAWPYRVPQPPFAEAAFIAKHAKASLDVSDGLLADAEHLAKASKVDLVIQGHCIPLAAPLGADEKSVLRQVTGGDDYQTLFLMSSEGEAQLDAAQAGGLQLTVIGRAQALSGAKAAVELRTADGRVLVAPSAGWDHFAAEQRQGTN